MSTATDDYLPDPVVLADAQLREELERLRPLAELGRMAATVAHEVRNPLAGISANAELLRESLSDPEDVESLDIILGEVERLGSLVTDLLLYSREREAEAAPIDLGVLARSTVDLLHSDADEAAVAITIEGEGLSWGDLELSRQALLNVVRNAIQACSPGACVTLAAAEGRLDVIDQGPGVPEPLRERLFEPFVTGRTRGLGLGAAVARRCLRRQRGDLELVATGAEGTTFRFTWPPRQQ